MANITIPIPIYLCHLCYPLAVPTVGGLAKQDDCFMRCVHRCASVLGGCDNNRPIQLDRGLLARVVRYSVRFTAGERGLQRIITVRHPVHVQPANLYLPHVVMDFIIIKLERSNIKVQASNFHFILTYFSARQRLQTLLRPLKCACGSAWRQSLQRLTFAASTLRLAYSCGLIPTICHLVQLDQDIERDGANCDYLNWR